MIVRRRVLVGIQKGTVSVAFSPLAAPVSQAGRHLLTSAGLLHIAHIEIVSVEEISNADAKRAGYENRESLIDELNERISDA